MKLWKNTKEKQSNIELIVENFTIGNDTKWDLLLAEVDVRGSIAHTTMLQSIGLISKEELRIIHEGLNQILITISDNSFCIQEGMEDIHSQIEFELIEKIGPTGKKIHAGRSRNDQSILDIKLYIKLQLKEIVAKMDTLFHRLIDLSNKHQNDLLPGYTHFQLAMPSSFGLWFGAYAESLCDDLELMKSAYNIANKNPLGSGAGYGSSFPLDRELTTELLDFKSLNYNSIYAQMTRGKTEKTTAIALATVAATLSKFSMDVCLYMNQNFAFIQFPKEFTTGSSIMPHKKNPDVFELIRAKCNRIQATPNELTLLTNNLPSGYHRDFQLTKECLFPAFQNLNDCLEIVNLSLENIEVRKNILSDDKYNLLFTVEKVNQFVLEGIPFREAYLKVAEEVASKNFHFEKNELKHSHTGSIGNLANKKITQTFNALKEVFI
jgi:argininosuccinate lyase